MKSNSLYRTASRADREKCHILNLFIGVIIMAFSRNFYVINRLAHYYYICGLEFSSYSLIAKKNRFFKKAEWAQVVCACLILAYYFVAFYKKYVGPESFGHYGFRDAWLPYKTFLTSGKWRL